MEFAQQNSHFPTLGLPLGLKVLEFRELNYLLNIKIKNVKENCYQICSMVKFVEQN
jgi:D-alanyl-lipoteichoic acid acyltransferase DltB (MBOAT superfamily)